MRSFGWLAVSGAFIAAACTRELEGAPCPCASGYECCHELNVCRRVGSACGSDASGGNASGGSPASSGGGSDRGGGALGGNGVGGSLVTSGSGGTTSESSTGGGFTAPTGGAFEGGASTGGAAGAPESGGDAGAPQGGTPSQGGAFPQPTFALVPTQHNDNARTGANSRETLLDIQNVTLETFGELSRHALRGSVFAQPLIAPSISIAGGEPQPVLYVATMGNVVYALDARDPQLPPLWSQELGTPIPLPDPLIDHWASRIWHQIGILSTPVLSVEQGALYVVAATKVGEAYAHTLYKLSLSTGQTLASRKIEHAEFSSSAYAQRAALTLAGDSLFVLFGSYTRVGGDGFVFAYDTDLAPRASKKLVAASVTMTGQGAAADEEGRLYFTTNRGTFDPAPTAMSQSSALMEVRLAELQLETNLRLVPPASAAGSNELGSSGPLLIPGSDRLLLTGQHLTYAWLKGTAAGVQEFQTSEYEKCLDWQIPCEATPTASAFWSGASSSGARVYSWAPFDFLRAFRYESETSTFDCGDSEGGACKPMAQADASESLDFLGATVEGGAQLSVSSDADRAGSGVVWALHDFANEGGRNADGILRAFDAESLKQLWDSQQSGTTLGALPAGGTPTVSGGRVFAGTASGVSEKEVFWDDRCGDTPAIASLGDRFLVLAWGRPPEANAPNRGFKLAWTADLQGDYTYGATSDAALSYEPALASDGASRLFLGYWASTHSVKVISSTTPQFARPTSLLLEVAGSSPVPLPYVASTAPALTWGDDTLFLAFHAQEQLHVVSAKNGTAFDPATLVTLTVPRSSRAPALAHFHGKLYLFTTSDANEMNVFVSSDRGAHFVGPTRLGARSAGHPALLAMNPEATAGSDYHLLWSDVHDDGTTPANIRSMWTRSGDLSGFSAPHVFEPESASFSISATRFRGAWQFAWCGGPDAQHPNVARYSSGELVTYGIFAR